MPEARPVRDGVFCPPPHAMVIGFDPPLMVRVIEPLFCPAHVSFSTTAVRLIGAEVTEDVTTHSVTVDDVQHSHGGHEH